MALQGTLDTFALPDVLRLLASTHKSGRLLVTTEQGDGRLWLTNGELTTTRFGENGDLPAVDVLFELLRSEDGKFEFDTDDAGPSDAETRELEPVLHDAERMLAEWRDVIVVVPSMRSRITLVDDVEAASVTIGREEWRQLAAIGGGSTPEELRVRFGLGELQAARAVKALVEAGVVRVGGQVAPVDDEKPEPVEAEKEPEGVDDEKPAAVDEKPEPVEAEMEPEAVEAEMEPEAVEAEMEPEAVEAEMEPEAVDDETLEAVGAREPEPDAEEGEADEPLPAARLASIPDAPEALLGEGADAIDEAAPAMLHEAGNGSTTRGPEALDSSGDLPEPLPGSEPVDRFAVFGGAPPAASNGESAAAATRGTRTNGYAHLASAVPPLPPLPLPLPTRESPTQATGPAEPPQDLAALSPDAARAIAAVMEQQGEQASDEPTEETTDAQAEAGGTHNRGLLLRLLGPNRN